MITYPQRSTNKVVPNRALTKPNTNSPRTRIYRGLVTKALKILLNPTPDLSIDIYKVLKALDKDKQFIIFNKELILYKIQLTQILSRVPPR